jgi:hypothetical protein
MLATFIIAMQATMVKLTPMHARVRTTIPVAMTAIICLVLSLGVLVDI